MLKPNVLFSDGLILQKGKPIRVFGEASSAVTVTLAGFSASADAYDGRFLVTLPAMSHGGPYTLTIASGAETVTLRDVYVGEVLLFSGQSNIQFHMKEESTPPAEYADDPLLRIFVCERPEAGERFHPADGWVRAARDTVDDWSALAYLVGRCARETGCAVGVIACSQGASVIQSWMPELCGTPLDVPKELLYVDHGIEQYRKWNVPGMLYRTMLTPLIPYALGNVVWYQGESNTSPAEGALYRELLGLMVARWRYDFDDARLPFYVVQLADTRDAEGWLLVQTAQTEAGMLYPGVRTVVCADVCERGMIHPVTKSKLAERLYMTMRENRTL